MDSKERKEKIKELEKELEKLKNEENFFAERDRIIRGLSIAIKTFSQWKKKRKYEDESEIYYDDLALSFNRKDNKISFKVDGLILNNLFYGDEINELMDCLIDIFTRKKIRYEKFENLDITSDETLS